MTATHPTLLGSCARATSAAEARFRIDTPRRGARSTRVVALDGGAATIVDRLAQGSWTGARILRYEAALRAGAVDLVDLALQTDDGRATRLGYELAGADFVMMVATDDTGAAAASAIGDACTLRGIMTAGLVLGPASAAGAAVNALRPHARVLLVSDDERDVDAVLMAVGS